MERKNNIKRVLMFILLCLVCFTLTFVLSIFLLTINVWLNLGFIIFLLLIVLMSILRKRWYLMILLIIILISAFIGLDMFGEAIRGI